MTGIIVPDGGTIGSASDTDAISIASDGKATLSQKPTFSQGIANTGTIDAGTLGSSVVSPASVGGIWKLLNRTAISGSPTSVEFINGSNGVVIDHSTYQLYRVICTGLGSTTNVTNLGMQLGKSNGGVAYESSGIYKITVSDRRSNHSGSLTSSTFQHIPVGGHVGANNGSGKRNMHCNIEFSLKDSTYPTVVFESVLWMDNDASAKQHGGASFSNGSYLGDDIDRIRLFFHTSYSSATVGTFQTMANEGHIAIYGLKTS